MSGFQITETTLGSGPGRIPFIGGDFDWLNGAALRVAASNADNAHGALLALLEDLAPAHYGMLSERRGASYAQLHAIADAAGLSELEREDWIMLAESIPLVERGALHIVGELGAEVLAS